MNNLVTSPQFSIIIPVYNAAEYLSSLMKQLQDQTLQNFEVIFVNDCSPDNSADILTRLAKEDERARVFHHEYNRCQGAARNTGLDNARGEFIVYIDADDSVPNNYLESLLYGIKKYDADMAICNSIWVYPDREVRRNMFIDSPDQEELVLTGEEAIGRFYYIFQGGIRIPVESWGRIIRRSMIERYHLRNPETIYEDIVMGYSELLFSHKVVLLNRYLYYYNRKNVSSDLSTKKKQYVRNFPLIFLGIQKVLIDHKRYEQHKKWLTRFYFNLLIGVYELFSNGEDLSKEMYEAILHYRSLLQDPLIDGSEEFISDKLLAFKFEMKRNNLLCLFSLFMEVHPEMRPLLRTNFRFGLIYCINPVMHYKSVRKLYIRILIDPRTLTRRLWMTHLIHICKRVVPNHYREWR